MWNFAEVSPWHVSSAPKHEEFFSSDNRSIAHSLVREATQNSGDAAEPKDAPVELRFRFFEVESQQFKDEYLHGLVEHLKAVAYLTPVLEPAIAQLDGDKVRVLLIEDFGTCGLTGPYDNPRAKGNFNSFWRRFGQSEKGNEKGGRHGVGKSTVASASAIKTVFGMTVRHDDGKRLLYGQATLRPHEIPGNDALFDSYGVFAANAPPAAPLPFEGDAINRFVETFGLSRHVEPGLSLVIPLPVEDLTSETLVVAVIEHCFHQILEGMLSVVVDGTTISSDTIETMVSERPDLCHLQEAIALSRSVIANPIPLAESSSDSRDRLDESEFDTAQLQAMRGRWLAGEIVGVKLHVPSIKPRGQEPEVGVAWLYVRKLEDPKQAEETYIRGRLLVPERRLTGHIGRVIMDFEKLRGKEANLEYFREWLSDTHGFNERSAGSVLSRLKRTRKLLGNRRFSDHRDAAHELNKNPDFGVLSPSVRSQLRRALELYEEFAR